MKEEGTDLASRAGHFGDGQIGAGRGFHGQALRQHGLQAFKLLAGFGGRQLDAEIIEFDGYVSRRRTLGRRLRGGQACAACEAPS